MACKRPSAMPSKNVPARKIDEQRKELERLATTDGLTGLCNRRCFLDRLEEEISRSRCFHLPLSLLLLDLDHFKDINDQHGHLVGDRVLVHVAQLVKDSLRRTDCAARFGGDEFCVLAIGSCLNGAERGEPAAELAFDLPSAAERRPGARRDPHAPCGATGRPARKWLATAGRGRHGLVPGQEARLAATASPTWTDATLRPSSTTDYPALQRQDVYAKPPTRRMTP